MIYKNLVFLERFFKFFFEHIGPEVLSIYRHDVFLVDEKQDKSPVTQADMKVLMMIRDLLKETGEPVCSEEDKVKKRVKGSYWLVDPLDGTKDFIEKTGEFSVMVSYIQYDTPVFGIVFLPIINAVYYAVVHGGAFFVDKTLKKRQVYFSPKNSLESLRLITSRHHMTQNDRQLISSLDIRTVIPCGSVGVKIIRMIEGYADLYMNTSAHTHVWDSAAPEVILTEAGGVITDMYGEKLVYNDPYAINAHGLLAAHKNLLSVIVPFTKQYETIIT